MWRRVRESNPGHSGGRRALSPLRHPLLPQCTFQRNGEWQYQKQKVNNFISKYLRGIPRAYWPEMSKKKNWSRAYQQKTLEVDWSYAKAEHSATRYTGTQKTLGNVADRKLQRAEAFRKIWWRRPSIGATPKERLKTDRGGKKLFRGRGPLSPNLWDKEDQMMMLYSETFPHFLILWSKFYITCISTTVWKKTQKLTQKTPL